MWEWLATHPGCDAVDFVARNTLAKNVKDELFENGMQAACVYAHEAWKRANPEYQMGEESKEQPCDFCPLPRQEHEGAKLCLCGYLKLWCDLRDVRAKILSVMTEPHQAELCTMLDTCDKQIFITCQKIANLPVCGGIQTI